jgi:predicted secreted hydrolase
MVNTHRNATAQPAERLAAPFAHGPRPTGWARDTAPAEGRAGAVRGLRHGGRVEMVTPCRTALPLRNPPRGWPHPSPAVVRPGGGGATAVRDRAGVFDVSRHSGKDGAVYVPLLRSLAAAIFLLLALAAPVAAQGFAGLGASPEGHALPERGRVFEFPADHGPHPAFRIEWWYVTANLTGPDGTRYGAQWTLFRTAPPADSALAQGWMGHAALTTPDSHHATERFARGGYGLAGVTADPFEAYIDEWRLVGPSFDRLEMRASAPAFAFDLALIAEGPLVLHGDAGYSVKSPAGQASHYYSQPHYRATGTITLPGGEIPVTGRAWLDREWSSQPLTESQTGWDWFSLHLSGGAKLMAYRLRDSAGPSFTPATWIAPDGTATALPDGAVRLTELARSDVEGRTIPTRWRLELPSRGVDLTVEALNPQAFNDLAFPYWEGPVMVQGSHTGEGFLEMTGY